MLLLTWQIFLLLGWIILLPHHILSIVLMFEMIFLSFMVRFSLLTWLIDDMTGITLVFILLIMAGLETALLLSQLLLYHRHHGVPQITRLKKEKTLFSHIIYFFF